MGKQRSDRSGERQTRQAQQGGHAPSPSLPGPATAGNRRLAEQTRKLLGRHYAAKYPGRRSG